MGRPKIFTQTRLINMRAEKEFEQKLEVIRKYYFEKLALELSNSDLLRLCVNRVYESITSARML